MHNILNFGYPRQVPDLLLPQPRVCEEQSTVELHIRHETNHSISKMNNNQ